MTQSLFNKSCILLSTQATHSAWHLVLCLKVNITNWTFAIYINFSCHDGFIRLHLYFHCVNFKCILLWTAFCCFKYIHQSLQAWRIWIFLRQLMYPSVLQEWHFKVFGGKYLIRLHLHCQYVFSKQHYQIPEESKKSVSVGWHLPHWSIYSSLCLESSLDHVIGCYEPHETAMHPSLAPNTTTIYPSFSWKQLWKPSLKNISKRRFSLLEIPFLMELRNTFLRYSTTDAAPSDQSLGGSRRSVPIGR